MPWPGDVHLNYRIISKPIIGPAIMAAATAYLPEDFFKKQYASIFTPHSIPDGFLEHIGVNMTVRYNSFVENSRQLIDMRPQIVEQSKRYASLQMPITLLHGTSDTSVYFHIHSQEFIKHVQHAKLHPISGMGHAVLQLAPDTVIKAIDAMISSE